MKKRFLLLILPLTVFLCLFSINSMQSSSAGTVTVQFELESTGYAKPGDEIQLKIYANVSGSKLAAFDFTIKYDSSLLEPKHDEFGEYAYDDDFFNSLANSKNVSSYVEENGTGVLQALYAASSLEATYVPEGKTLLYTCYFVVKATASDGTAAFSLSNPAASYRSSGGSLTAVPSGDVTSTTAATTIKNGLSSDNNLGSLTVSTGTLSPSFDPSVTSYTVNVTYAASSITLTASANDALSTVVGAGTKTLEVGDNSFEITVTAQNGAKKVYTVTVNRKAASTDNTLQSLTVSEGALSPTFDPSEIVYNVTVPYEITSITLAATANDILSTVAGTGTKNLNIGNNSFAITVTAENGTQKIYTVNVTREKCTDNTLKLLTVSGGTLTPPFSPSDTVYNVTVPYETDSITITAEKNHDTATVTGAGVKSLAVGSNSFEITVTAQNGAQKKYTLNVTREKCADNTLKSLSVSGYQLEPSFDKSVLEYVLRVPYELGSITISAEKNHSTATLTGTGTMTLPESGSAVFSVKVTAQNSNVKEYKITVIKADPSTDNTLKSLTTNTGTWDKAFSPSQTSYVVTVPYATSSITLSATVNDVLSTATGMGTKTLVVGNNTFEITVTAQSGDKKVYTVTVNRKAASTDNTLKSLTTNTGSWDKAFNPSETSYKVTVPYTTSGITITAAVNDALSTVTGAGNKSLNVGDNSFVITVKAESGAQKQYTVTVTREKCTDNTLKSLSVNGYTLTPSFSPSVPEYKLNVPYVVNSITISAQANHTTATVSGIGTKTLAVGENTFAITVSAQNGTTKVYTIIVTRKAASTDNNLKSLTINTGTLLPSFSPSETSYEVTVPYAVSSITLNAEVNDALSTLSGTGTKELSVGENVFEITVTAQNGAKKVYTVTVTRQNASTDNNLKSLTTNTGEWDNAFDPELTSYIVRVPYAVTSITLNAVVNDALSTLSGAGAKELSVGENVFGITVTAEDGSDKTYTVTVNRDEPSSDSTLKSIAPSAGTLTPEFDPEITVYDVTVGYKYETIGFDWETSNPGANVFISGDDYLEAGDVTVYTITVIAEDGSSTFYIINVTRLLQSDDASLSSLEVGGTRLNFDPEITDYDVGVPEGIKTADIQFTVRDENASAVLEGDVDLDSNKPNVFTITVTAENGNTKVYTIIISYREIESDSSLTSLTDSTGTLEFIRDIKNYSIKVPYSTDVIEFEYTLGGKYATSVLEGPEMLEAGTENEYRLTVIAEDSSFTVYTITVYRMPASEDSALKYLSVKGYDMTPEFDPGVTIYDVYIPYSAVTAVVEFEPNHQFASVEYNAPDELVPGEINIFTVRVISESGNATLYTIRVFRDVISDDSSLSELKLKNAVLEPEFAPDEVNYTASVPYSVAVAEFEYKASHMGSDVIVSGPDELAVGENIYKIVVKAETGAQTIYTVTITRAEMESDSTLKTLVPSVGEIEFDPLVTEYNITLDCFTELITFEYEASGMYASVTFNGNENLTQGETNVFVISVIAEDGSRTDYTVNVFREMISSDSSAAKITVMGKELDLSSGRREFLIDVSYDTERAEVVAYANDSKSSVEIKRERETLAIGENVITVIITAQDKSVTEYKIKILRDAGSSNAYLEKLEPENGSFNEAFEPNKLNYTMTVGQEIDKLVLIIKPAHEKAVFEVSDTKLEFGENVITITVTSENGNTVLYKVRVMRQKDSFWKMITSNTIFTVGGFGITIFMFVAAALAVIVICVVILIIVKVRSSKDRK